MNHADELEALLSTPAVLGVLPRQTVRASVERLRALERELAEARADVTRWEESAAKWATERIEKHGTAPPAEELADMRFQLAQARAELEAVRKERDENGARWSKWKQEAQALDGRLSRLEAAISDYIGFRRNNLMPSPGAAAVALERLAAALGENGEVG